MSWNPNQYPYAQPGYPGNYPPPQQPPPQPYAQPGYPQPYSQPPAPYSQPPPQPYAQPGYAPHPGYAPPQPYTQQPPFQPYAQPPPQQYAPPQQPYYPPQQYTLPAVYGKRKCLLIGINYLDNPTLRLEGPLTDVRKMRDLLMSKFAFQDSVYTMVVLSDDQTDPYKRPTKANILTAMKWLVSDVQPGDSLFFYFSGHGGQVRDTSGDEDDGLDEAILPCDYKTAGSIIDDVIHDVLVKPLPYNARLTAVLDCCHSGTGMDLPYAFTAADSSPYMHTYQPSYGKKQHRQYDYFGYPAQPQRDGELHMTGPAKNQSVGDVVCFGGCRDEQTAADATIISRGTKTSGGAMTSAFIQAVTQPPTQPLSYIHLLRAIGDILKQKRYTQVAQLTCGRPMDLNQPFTL